MTPLESEVLQRFGLGYLQSLGALSIYVFFYGVFVVLFSASVVISMRRGFSNRPRTAIFVATVINFLISSLYTGGQATLLIVSIRKALVLDLHYPLPEKPDLVENALRNVTIGFIWAATCSIWLSDLIVIWRAWAIFPDRRWVISLPFILWIGSVGTTFADQTWLSTRDDRWGSNVDISLTIAGNSLSLATNAVTTMMIAYKLWIYSTLIVQPFGLSGRKSPVQTILTLLVESGLVFLGFQTTFLVSTAVESPYTMIATPFVAMYYSLAAIYPTVVILLVETHRSMTDIYEISPLDASKLAGTVGSEARLATLGYLSFAVRPIHSTMDAGAESQDLCVLQSQGGQECGLEKVLLKVKE